jgi:1-acyl-sn-glycerol-3-phosphate acyltransferase
MLCLVVSTIVLSLLAYLTFPFDRKGWMVHRYARAWGWLIVKSSGVTVTLAGVDVIEKGRPQIFMANHQGAFDIFSLLAYLPVDFKWVAREEIFGIPVLGWAMKAAGYISIDRKGRKKAVESLERAVARIRNGTSVLVFPEGTRSPDGSIHAFKKGGFTLAVKARVPIVPVSIRGSRDVLPRSSLRVRPGRIDIHVGEAIPTEGRTLADRNELMEAVRRAIETGSAG